MRPRKLANDKCQRQYLIGSVGDGKESVSIMADEMKILKAHVAECVAKTLSSMEGRMSSMIEEIKRIHTMQNAMESTIVDGMKAEVSSMEEHLASRYEALSDRQSVKRLMREETEMDQSVKRPRMEPTVSSTNAAPGVKVEGREGG